MSTFVRTIGLVVGLGIGALGLISVFSVGIHPLATLAIVLIYIPIAVGALAMVGAIPLRKREWQMRDRLDYPALRRRLDDGWVIGRPS